MMSVTGGLVCLATLATTSAFVAPLAVHHGTPLASSSKAALLRMSSKGGDDPPLVFPRSSVAFLSAVYACTFCCRKSLGWLAVLLMSHPVVRPTPCVSSYLEFPPRNMSLIVCVLAGVSGTLARRDRGATCFIVLVW